MKFEKRSAGADLTPEETPTIKTPAEAPAEVPKEKAGGKPVILYIMILFIVAFLLMALSLLMHQRTTAEGIGELQHSVSAIQDMQAHQEKVIELQEELNIAKDTIIQLENDLEAQRSEAEAAADALKDKNDALTNLAGLQSAYHSGDYALCRTILLTMETLGQPQLLPSVKESSLPTPAEVYAAIEADVEQQLTQQAEQP